MDTKAWGKNTWSAMFFVAAGYELNSEPRHIKDHHYFNFFKEIGYVLGCKYCRESYQNFFAELAPEGHLNDFFNKPCGLLEFVYTLKNKVNNKLIKQESTVALQKYKDIVNSNLSDEEILFKLKDISKVFYTQDTPSFPDIVNQYMKHQAKCSSKLKSCRKDESVNSELFMDPKSMTETMFYSKGGLNNKKTNKKKSKKKKKTKIRSKKSR